ncbi:MAG: ParD-like family protein [Methylococcaceae bacterium]
MNIAIEIEQELYERAQKEAEIKQRSIPKQIEFWARLGRAALDNPDLPIEFVHDLLIAKAEDRALATPFVPEGKRVND